jgi:hypothetical protein
MLCLCAGITMASAVWARNLRNAMASRSGARLVRPRNKLVGGRMAYRMLTANFEQAAQAKAPQHAAQGRRAFGISRPAFSDSLSVVSRVLLHGGGSERDLREVHARVNICFRGVWESVPRPRHLPALPCN